MARAIEKKLFKLPIASGINQAIDDRDAPPGTLTACTNHRIKKSLLVKRPGYAAFDASKVDSTDIPILGDGTTTYVEEPSLLASIGDAKALGTTSGAMFVADRESGADWFSVRGHFSTARPYGQRSHVSLGWSSTSVGTKTQSVAINTSNYHAAAWISDDPSGSSKFVIVAVSSNKGKPIGTLQFSVAVANQVVLLALGETFVAIFNDDGTVYAKGIKVLQGALSIDSSTTLHSFASGTTVFDAVALSTTRYWVAASQLNATTITLDDVTYGNSPTTDTITLTDASVYTPLISLWYNSDTSRVWVSYTDYDSGASAGVQYIPKYKVYLTDGTFTVVSSHSYSGEDVANHAPQPYSFGRFRGNTIDALPTTLGIRRRYVTTSGGSNYTIGYTDVVIDSALTHTTKFPLVHCMPVTKPDDYGRFWAITWDDPNIIIGPRDPTSTYWYVLLRIKPLRTPTLWASPVIELVTDQFPGGDDYALLSLIVPRPLSAIALGSDFRSVVLPCNLGSAMDMREILFTTGEIDPHVEADIGDPATVTAGQPTEHFGAAEGYVLDGSGNAINVLGGAEIGYAQKPQIFAVTSTASTENRSYVAVYVWADIYGRAHRSAPSLPFAAANKTVLTVLVSALQIGQRRDWNNTAFSPYIEVYSTVDGGTEYFLAATDVPSLAYDATIEITLSLTDLQLEARPILYTDGGVLPNTLAPSNSFQAFSDDRLWVGGGFDPRILTCSKIIIPQEPILFTNSQAFQVVIPGNVTGLAFMDGSVIAFTAKNIYQISGQGPNDQGIGGFGEPTLIASGIGCANYKSVLRTDLGILFQADSGFYLLPRGLGTPQFIGANVRDSFASRSTVLGAAVTHDETYYLARWLMSSDGATGQYLLCFDIERQVWFEDQISTDGGDFSELGLWPTGLALMRQTLDSTDGFGLTTMFLEDDTKTLDGIGGAALGTAFNHSATTAWAYPFDVGGYGHIRKLQLCVELLGTSATVALSVTVDGNAAEARTWALSGSAGDIFYRQIDIEKDQGGCVKVTLSDSSGGSGFKPVYCVLEVEDDGGIRLLSSTERAL